MNLEEYLICEADKRSPIDPEWPDARAYREDVQGDALDDSWLDKGTSYVWKVGVLAQYDSNKCDYVWLYIGQERKPGHMQFLGALHWSGGENDDIGRCLERVIKSTQDLHPVFHAN